MKFLVDAQLPRRLSYFLQSMGEESVHTLDLPLGNVTKDSEIKQLADIEDRVVITKDLDFYDSFIFSGSPRKLLLVATGNVKNQELLLLFEKNLSVILSLFAHHKVVEISSSEIIVHY